MADPFDDLLGLEDKFYAEGYELGARDGSQAGRIEGRVFGLEKGFEKYVEMGKLYGKSLIWNGRHSQLQAEHKHPTSDSLSLITSDSIATTSPALSNLPANPRLEKHLRVLYALTEPASLSTENTEDAVSDFDDRLKRAQGKVKIIERLVGEESLDAAGQGNQPKSGQNIEDVDILKARH